MIASTKQPKPYRCLQCGETDPAKFYGYPGEKGRCKRCHTKAVLRRRRRQSGTAIDVVPDAARTEEERLAAVFGLTVHQYRDALRQ